MGWMRPYWINSVNSKDFIMLKCDICEKIFDKLKNARSINKHLCGRCYQNFRNNESIKSKAKNPEKYIKLREDYVKSGRRKAKAAEKVELRRNLNICTECGLNPRCEHSQKCLECYSKHKASSRKHLKSKYGDDSISRFEKYVYDFLVFKFPSLCFERNIYNKVFNPETGKSLILDIYSDVLKIAIEVDGDIHRKNCYGQKRLEYQLRMDNIKDLACIDNKIILIRINTEHIDFNKIESMGILSEALERIINRGNVQRLTGERIQLDKPDTNIQQPLLAEDIVRPWWKHQDA